MPISRVCWPTEYAKRAYRPFGNLYLLPQGQSKASEFQFQFSSQSSILRRTTPEVRYHIGVDFLKSVLPLTRAWGQRVVGSNSTSPSHRAAVGKLPPTARQMSSELLARCRFGAIQDVPVEPWRAGLLERGLPVHLVNHLATMADLHRAGRYDRMSDDVLTLTGQGPLSMQGFVRKNAATFTASAKEA
jgi:hypothetical protein